MIFGGKRQSQETKLQCLPAFMTIDKESQLGPVWILGMPFLRYHYTVFDRHSKKLHIAPSTPACSPIQSAMAGFANISRLAGAAGLHGGVGAGMFTASDFA